MNDISRELFHNIRRIQINSNRSVNDLLRGAYKSAFKGQGIEFEEVREYLPGDDVRTIDWNVTARLNHPYVKNFREERELTVMLLVDISASTRFGTTGKQKQELMAEIGATLAFSAITNNDKVGIILFSDKVEKYIPPRKGFKHILRIIRELLTAKSRDSGTDIAQALDFLSKVQKKMGVCFIISDFIASGYAHQCAMAAKHYDLIALCLTDPKEIKLPSIGLLDIKDLESGETLTIDTNQKKVKELLYHRQRQRIENHKKLMKKIGAGFIEIHTDRSYVQPLREYFILREKRR
ncbi:MAG: DUF58 domain-containing protein [Chlamydiota bacterium]